MPRRRMAALSRCALPCTTPVSGAAQAWPDRPLRFIVGFGAGGSSDIIAFEAAARAEPAGHAMVLGSPAFALKLAPKDVTPAVTMGRDLGVAMRLCNLTLEEMNEARNRGWDDRDSRVPMLLPVERAGARMEADAAAIKAVLDADKA